MSLALKSISLVSVKTIPARETIGGTIFLPAETARMVEKYKPYNPPREDVRILVISDLNSSYGSTEYENQVHLAIKMIPFWQPDIVICGGDMIASQKASLTEAQIKAMWEAFDSQIAKPIRDLRIPFAFTLGNHDASSVMVGGKFLFAKDRKLAKQYWQNPKHKPKLNYIDTTHYPFYYTFEEKGIFFLVWDASSNRIPEDKLRWVEKSLASKRAQRAKMRIVIGHLPLYGVAARKNHPGEVLANGDGLRRLLEKYNVHTYISGHHHAYYPAKRGTIQLLHAGALGQGPRHLIGEDDKLPPKKTLTVVDIDFNSGDLTKYTTYDMEDFSLINYQQLPRLIMGENGMIIRRDLRATDVSKLELDACLAIYSQREKCRI
ncbi:MAG: metallophosphoesterase [Geminocystis sp.]|nr:metallophosphoesterase [Geminocystis sp.]MDW8115538.1 metallophosphoesterase [Geminocystis sp.]